MAITKELQNKEVSEDGSVSFVCETSSPAPSSHVRWEKNGIPLQKSSTCEISHEGNRYKVILEHVKPSDEGDYACVIIINDKEDIRSVAHLSIRSKF